MMVADWHLAENGQHFVVNIVLAQMLACLLRLRAV